MHDNSGVTDGSTLTSLLLSVSDTPESYQESNPSAATPNAIAAGQGGEWDWSIEDNGAPNGTQYCFRMIHNNGQVLKDFNSYPQLITNNPPDTPTLVSPFDDAKASSTLPMLNFSAIDDNSDHVN